MGSNNVPPPHVLAHVVPLCNLFLKIGGGLWTLYYLLLVRESFKSQSFGMPLFTIALMGNGLRALRRQITPCATHLHRLDGFGLRHGVRDNQVCQARAETCAVGSAQHCVDIHCHDTRGNGRALVIRRVADCERYWKARRKILSGCYWPRYDRTWLLECHGLSGIFVCVELVPTGDTATFWRRQLEHLVSLD